MPIKTFDAPKKLLVYMPTWLGDCVMASPTLIHLRKHLHETHVSLWVSKAMEPIVCPFPAADEVLTYDKKRGPWKLSRELKSHDFDAVLLLSNSFRSAMTCRLAGIPRRIGYARDNRSWLLTDKSHPAKANGRYAPTPTLTYYRDLMLDHLVDHETLNEFDGTMKLWTQPETDNEAQQLLQRAGYSSDSLKPLVLFVPGGNKLEKRWPIDRFAALAKHLMDCHGATIALSGSPNEAELLGAIGQAINSPRVINLVTEGCDLRLLKSIIHRCALVVTNDTGPRHVAAAMDRPLVSLFGPTPVEWTVIDCPYETVISAPDSYDVQGQLKPEGGTMTAITVDAVIEACDNLLAPVRKTDG